MVQIKELYPFMISCFLCYDDCLLRNDLGVLFVCLAYRIMKVWVLIYVCSVYAYFGLLDVLYAPNFTIYVAFLVYHSYQYAFLMCLYFLGYRNKRRRLRMQIIERNFCFFLKQRYSLLQSFSYPLLINFLLKSSAVLFWGK